MTAWIKIKRGENEHLLRRDIANFDRKLFFFYRRPSCISPLKGAIALINVGECNAALNRSHVIINFTKLPDVYWIDLNRLLF